MHRVHSRPSWTLSLQAREVRGHGARGASTYGYQDAFKATKRWQHLCYCVYGHTKNVWVAVTYNILTACESSRTAERSAYC